MPEPIQIAPISRFGRIQVPSFGVPVDLDRLAINHRLGVGRRRDKQTSLLVNRNLGYGIGVHFVIAQMFRLTIDL